MASAGTLYCPEKQLLPGFRKQRLTAGETLPGPFLSARVLLHLGVSENGPRLPSTSLGHSVKVLGLLPSRLTTQGSTRGFSLGPSLRMSQSPFIFPGLQLPISSENEKLIPGDIYFLRTLFPGPQCQRPSLSKWCELARAGAGVLGWPTSSSWAESSTCWPGKIL